MYSDDSSGSDVPELVPRDGDSISVPTNSGVNQDHGMNRFQATNSDDSSGSDVPEDNGNSVTTNTDDSSGSDVPELGPRGGFQKHDLDYIPDLFLPTNSGVGSSDIPELVPRWLRVSET